MADVFVLIPTHTTRHLAACLASLAHQMSPPKAVVVTCDTDDTDIGDLLDDWGVRVQARLQVEVPIWHTFRPHQGRAQLNQVRNNGLRALRDHAGIEPCDLVVVLDGDNDARARCAAASRGAGERRGRADHPVSIS